MSVPNRPEYLVEESWRLRLLYAIEQIGSTLDREHGGWKGVVRFKIEALVDDKEMGKVVSVQQYAESYPDFEARRAAQKAALAEDSQAHLG